jgi:hypothetical protein
MAVKTEYFKVLSVGLCFATVCTDLPDGEAGDRLNASHPTGISSRWEVSEEDFKDGTPNGVCCEKDPTRRHVLFVC